VAARIPNKFGLKPPTFKYSRRCYRKQHRRTNLNARLQEKLNPPPPKRRRRKLASTAAHTKHNI